MNAVSTILSATSAAIAWRVGAALALAPPAGWALARLAGRFCGPRPPSAGWMTGGVFVMALGAFTAGRPAAISLGFGSALLILIAVDAAVLRLPDLITLPLVTAGLIVSMLEGSDLLARSLGCALGFTALATVDRIYVAVRGRAGLGLGDAKLFAAAGAWFGWEALPFVLLLACAGGLAWAAGRVLTHGRRALREPLPFGVPLSLAMWGVWLACRRA